MHSLLSSSTATAGKVLAIVVFGDSTVDPGNNNYIPTIAKGNFPPYGRDFYGGVATGRFSNGRLVTDFVSETLGLGSSVLAYLDSSYTIDQLATGVSFASGGTGLDDLTAKVAVSHSESFTAFGFNLIGNNCTTEYDATFPGPILKLKLGSKKG